MNIYDATEQAFKNGEWDMFERVTSAYYGKQFYFLEPNGKAYSRNSAKEMSREDAINEFLNSISL